MFPPSEFNSDIFSEFVDSYLEIQRRVQKFFNQLNELGRNKRTTTSALKLCLEMGSCALVCVLLKQEKHLRVLQFFAMHFLH